MKVIGAPKRIWLNIGSLDDALDDVPFGELAEVSWCADRQGDADIEYVRADDAVVQAARELHELTAIETKMIGPYGARFEVNLLSPLEAAREKLRLALSAEPQAQQDA